MFKNYIIIAFRNILKHKMFSFINIFGLSIGLAGCLLIIGFITSELSFEDFHQNKNRIYRTCIPSHSYINTWTGLATEMKNKIPEFESVINIRVEQNTEVKVNNSNYKETIFFSEPDYFNIFSFPILEKYTSGNILAEPFTALITEKYKEKYFSNETAIDKVIRFFDTDFKIVGIIKNIPSNTQLNSNIIASYSSLEKMKDNNSFFLNNWKGKSSNDVTFVMTKKEISSLGSINTKIRTIIKEKKGWDEDKLKRNRVSLQPIKDVYFKSFVLAFTVSGNIKLIFIMSTIALILLILAVLNYINLSTAKITFRMKEIGVRKAIGASKSQLVKQFLIESIVLTFISMLLSLTFYDSMRIYLGELTGKVIDINLFSNVTMIFSILSLTIIVGFIAGLFPAYISSKYNPILIISSKKNSKSILRKALIIIQYTITIVMIFATIIIYKQQDYISNYSDIGFDTNNLVILKMESSIRDKISILKDEISRNKNVISVSSSSKAGHGHSLLGTTYSLTKEIDPNMNYEISVINIDENFISTTGLNLIKGRNIEIINKNQIIVNETFLKTFNITENPIGLRIFDGLSKEVTIVGVVKDFHSRPLKHNIMPMVLTYNPRNFWTISIRIADGNFDQFSKDLESIWSTIVPDKSINYYQLNEFIEEEYQKDEQAVKLFMFFSLLVIIIASLGIFGLASFVVTQRTKEIGIRKVFGSSSTNIVKILTFDFLKWVLLSNIIAWPIGYYIMDLWLNSYPYKIEINFQVFIISGLIAITIATISVSFQTIKASMTKPVNSLKDE